MQGQQPPPQWYAPPAAAPAQPYYGAQVADADTMMMPVSWGPRAGARIIDTIITAVVSGIGGGVGGAIIGGMVATHALPQSALQSAGGLGAGSFAFSMLGPVAYHVLAEGIGGATVGKVALGMRVTNEQGAAPSFGGVIVRNLAYFIDAFFFGLVAYGVMNGSRWQQRLGDKWGHTMVLSSRTMNPAQVRSPALGIVVGLLGAMAIAFVSTIVKVL